jgi:hypothetical protein
MPGPGPGDDDDDDAALHLIIGDSRENCCCSFDWYCRVNKSIAEASNILAVDVSNVCGCIDEK